MKFKKLWLISLLLLLVLMIGATSASSDSTDIAINDESDNQIIQANIDSDTAVSDESDDDLILAEVSGVEDSTFAESSGSRGSGSECSALADNSVADAEVYGETNNENLGASPASFKNLNDAINSGSISIDLPSDFEYKNDDADAAVTQNGAILIRRNITIHGNGHTIDAKGLVGIFLVYGDITVIITDLNFKNGVGVQNVGGAIFSQGFTGGAKLYLSNCNFTNNIANSNAGAGVGGGAIYATNTTLDIKYSNFNIVIFMITKQCEVVVLFVFWILLV